MTLHIDVYEHAGFVTVSEMRRLIARAVSKLKGDSPAVYSFNAKFPDQFQITIDDKTPRGKTVSEMRRHLARFFPALPDNDPVTFSFHCKVAVN